MSKMIPAGIVTAYGAAVRGGYPGTYEEFCAALGDLARVLEDFEGFSVEVETLEPGSSATASYSDGVLALGIPKGDTGNGIASAELNQNYTLTLTWTNGESTTVGPIRGAVGATPDFSIGTVTTGAAGSSAEASITGTPEEPVLNLTIPKGDPGEVPAAAIAPTEASTTASQAYAIGDYFWLSGTLYEATAAITQGGTIVVGTNCKTAEIGETLTQQKNAIGQNEEAVADTQSMIATVETTTTASNNYAVGDLLVYDGKLYKVTSTIAAGATIIVGSNVTQTTVEEQLGSGGGAVNDVQINGTSIVTDGVANIPITGANRPGVMIVNGYNGHNIVNGILVHRRALTASIKQARESNEPIVPLNQHESTFYGLAKAAGDSTQSESANAVGNYTDDAKSAIQTMLGVAGIIGTVEGATASKSYAIGDAFLHSGALYKATASIASGDAITPGTNCTQTTLISIIKGE